MLIAGTCMHVIQLLTVIFKLTGVTAGCGFVILGVYTIERDR